MELINGGGPSVVEPKPNGGVSDVMTLRALKQRIRSRKLAELGDKCRSRFTSRIRFTNLLVRVARTDSDQFTLSVRDEGVGLPTGFDPHKAKGLGMES